jgi:hypothetical protein
MEAQPCDLPCDLPGALQSFVLADLRQIWKKKKKKKKFQGKVTKQ